MTRTRRSLYTMAAGYLNTGVGLLSGLIATPFLVLWLGDDRVGLTRMAVDWFGYAALIGLGLDGALNVRYAKSASAGDRPAMLALIRGGVRAYFLVSLGSMVWIGLLFAFAPLAFNLPAASSFTDELRAGLLIVMLGQLGMLFAAFKPLAEAEQRGYIANISLAIGGLVGMIVSLVSAYHGGGLAGQLLALTLMTFTGTFLIALDGLRRYPEILRHPLGSYVGGLHGVFAVMLLFQICGRVSFLSDNIIVGQVLGVSAVAAFAFTQRLILLLQTVIFVIGGATWGALASIYHSGQHDAFHHRLVQLTRLVAVLACAAIVPAAAWNRQFVLAWVGKPELYAGDALTWLTAATAAVQCLLALWGWPILTMGHVRKILPYYVGAMCLSIPSSIAATYWLGPVGPAIGALVNIGCVMVWASPRVIERELGTPARKLLLAAAGPWLLAIPYGIVLHLIAGQFELTDYFTSRIVRMALVAVLVGIAAVGYILLAFLTVLPATDRREWLGRFLKRKQA